MKRLTNEAYVEGFRTTMNCPVCNSRDSIEVIMNAGGYAKNLLECASCGSIWASQIEEVEFVLRNCA